MSEEGESKPIIEEKSGERASCWSRMRAVLTVEPIAFLYTLGFVLSTSTNQQYSSFYYGISLGGDYALLSVGICSLNENSTQWVATVQELAAGYLSYFSLLNNLPMLVAAILMGSLSDVRGRKLVLVLPVVGGIIRACVAIGVEYTRININYMYIGAFIEGMMGGSAVVGLALFSYIADISTTQRRSWRMLFLFVAESIGIGLAEIIAGYLITYTDFLYPYTMVLCIYVMCLVIIFFYVRETVTTEGAPSGKACISLFHFRRTFGLLFRKSKEGLTAILWIAITMLFFVYAEQGLASVALYLYVTQDPLCFTWVQVGYLIATIFILHAVLGPLSFRVLHGRLRDLGLIALAAIDGILGQIYLAIQVDNIIYVYFQPLVSFMAAIVMPLARALVSNTVSANEQGAAQGIAAVSNVAGLMIGTVTSTTVYAATATTYTGSSFVVAAGVYLLILICDGVIAAYMKKQPAATVEPIP